MRKIITCILAALIMVVPASTAMAAEQKKNVESISEYDAEIMDSIPTMDLTDNNDGTFAVKVIDMEGNIIFESESMAGSADEVMGNVYGSIYEPMMIACSHIPWNHEIVWGGINHIINGTTCTMVRSKFYKCAGCNAIIGVVPNSTVVVGTHAAH